MLNWYTTYGNLYSPSSFTSVQLVGTYMGSSVSESYLMLAYGNLVSPLAPCSSHTPYLYLAHKGSNVFAAYNKNASVIKGLL